MFRAVEKFLTERGVNKFVVQSKVHEGNDHTKLFEFLGYRMIEKVFSKTLGA